MFSNACTSTPISCRSKPRKGLRLCLHEVHDFACRAVERNLLRKILAVSVGRGEDRRRGAFGHLALRAVLDCRDSDGFAIIALHGVLCPQRRRVVKALSVRGDGEKEGNEIHNEFSLFDF